MIAALALTLTIGRLARAEAEQRLDRLGAQYVAAVAGAGAGNAAALRRQLDDAKIAVRVIEERERLNEESLTAELESMRKDPSAQPADIALLTREIEELRADREADLARRAERTQQTRNRF